MGIDQREANESRGECLTESAVFWSLVAIGRDGDCWPWLDRVGHDGYGRYCLNGADRQASRHALILATGQDPEDLHALHSCDNPRCCNPKHLRWGTRAENMQDMVARGRWKGPGDQAGAANGAAKLTDKGLAVLVGRLNAGLNNLQCAEGLPIGHSMVSKIRVGLMWREQTAALGWEPKPQFRRALPLLPLSGASSAGGGAS